MLFRVRHAAAVRLRGVVADALSQGAALVEQFWQRLVPRAGCGSPLLPPLRLADDAKRVASKLLLSAVRPMGLTAAGGAERCRIEVRAESLATFVDPATGGRAGAACGVWWKGAPYDPMARAARRWS